ncbi:MAG TPA: cupin domain-containing protein [Streptosporangiaceae bacterium]|jgi:mannose-6-phosphate isomerase-like protein (cupin superfamily)
MPVVRAADAVEHELHGSVFTSYAAPASGSRELCAWRLEVPGRTTGIPHTVSKEEVLLVLSGRLSVTLSGGAAADGAFAGQGAGAAAGSSAEACAGDAIVVPAGTVLKIDNLDDQRASAWVTTSVGLEAVLADGSSIRPPWVR